MRIDNNPNISFRARCIKFHDYIPQIESISKITGKRELKDVSCIELGNSDIDMKALYDISRVWRYDYTNFTTNIYHNALEKQKGQKFYDKYRTFAITKQKNNFDVLDPSQIVSVTSVEESIPDTVGYLAYIQTDPDNFNNGAGTALIRSLQHIYNHITLKSEKSQSVKNFYRKNDFIEYPQNSCNFSWTKDIFSMLGIREKQ